MSTSSIKGLALSGLQGDTFGGATYKTAAEVEAEIDAAKNNFNCTAVRLQIQQQLLVGNNGDQFDSTYLSTVNAVVQHALDAGLTVIINCQTENASPSRAINYPNQGNEGTDAFWSRMAPPWNGNPSVIFDLFNEPDCNPGNPGGDWTLWQSSFNSLISYLRTTLSVTNTLWADADNWAASFQGCPGLTDSANNLVYSFHHPPSAAGGNSAGWDTDFGNWASSHAVVNGEFAQNQSFNWGSPYDVQAYLAYLTSKGIGQTVWTTFKAQDDIADASKMPWGWWGGMIANANNPSTGPKWHTYCYRSSVKWEQNYRKDTGAQISWAQVYQGWSASFGSMLVGALGYNDLTANMAAGGPWKIHVAFKCVHANADPDPMTAIVGVHQAAAKPSTYSGLSALTNIVSLNGCLSGKFYQVDIPQSYLVPFASGQYKGIVFGPGPSSDVVYQGHMDDFPQLVLESYF